MSLLPLPVSEAPWPPNIRNAYRELSDHYLTINGYIQAGSVESHRLERYHETVIFSVFPLLQLLDQPSVNDMSLPTEWLEDAATKFVELLTLVREQLKSANDEPESGVIHHRPVTRQKRVGQYGQPRKNINEHILRQALSRNRRISLTALAKILGVHRDTLRARIKELDDIKTGFDEISDAHLDDIIRKYLEDHPTAGRRYTIGYLSSAHNLRVQRQRVVDSLQRVDALGQSMRARVSAKKKRQVYSVPRPNALWHIDGHHKLILWGIVIHGVADGFSRKTTGLRASTSNTASTVLEMFCAAVEKHGLPSRVRGDRGGENRDVSILMILLRGANRASFMWGSSVFNTRIERLWVEVGKRFVRSWRAFFLRLEHMHFLDRKNRQHRWLLHYLFLESINNDCDNFMHEWNAHPISGVGGNYSPDDLAFMGELKHGSYADECAGLSEEQINAFYGFDEHGEPLQAEVESDDFDNTTNASDSDQPREGLEEEDTSSDNDSEDSESGEIGIDMQSAEPYVAGIVDRNIQHEPVHVPRGQCPFDDAQLHLFEEGLSLLRQHNEVPSGYGIDSSEWGSEGYPTTETITVGLRKLSFPISLPDAVWRPRAQDWTRALYLMNQILN